MKTIISIIALSVLMALPAHAEDSWTEIGGYIFASQIKGDSQIRNVTTNVDITFGDILDHLDLGAMGFIEHHQGKWLFIGDIGHMTLSDEKSFSSNGILNVSLDAEFKQTTIHGLVGYRAFEQNYGAANISLDVLGGFRYVFLEADIGVQASALGLTASGSRNRNEEWADAVVGVRAQYKSNNGWGASLRADIGKGSNSDSYQLIGLINYDFKNNWKVFAGYQLLHLEYEEGVGASRFGIDLDYFGPRFGVTHRF